MNKNHSECYCILAIAFIKKSKKLSSLCKYWNHTSKSRSEKLEWAHTWRIFKSRKPAYHVQEIFKEALWISQILAFFKTLPPIFPPIVI